MKYKFPPFRFYRSYFIFLLPLFFVFHGFVENYAMILPWDAAQLFLYYVVVSCAISVFVLLFFRSWPKAFFFSFLVMALHFFFGSLHDGSKKIFGNPFFTSYSFVLPLMALLLLTTFVLIKKTNLNFSRFTRYLNVVLICLVALDASTLFNKILKKSYYGKNVLPATFTTCDTCAKPDVYLIVADEYAGYEELKNIFRYDNSPFEKNLAERGFQVVKHSKSNYNFTPFSIASLLNLSYLPIPDTAHTAKDLAMVMNKIQENTVTHFFYKQGYQVFNNAIFDLPGEPAQAASSFLPYKTKYITAQTLVSRMERDLYYHLITDLKWQWLIKKDLYTNLESNNRLYKRTIAVSKQHQSPKFSYTHLSMPHWPYYFDENGNAYSYHTLLVKNDKPKYLSYLKYSNKKLLHLIDEILQNSNQPPVILLASDHGFRLSDKPQERSYSFMNLCAVYQPGKNGTAYYEGLSLVNVFRILLNQHFGQQLPLLEDACIYLKD